MDIILTGSQDKTAKVWSYTTGELLRTLTDHTDAVMFVAFSQCGSLAATSSNDCSVFIWNCANWSKQHICIGHRDRVLSVSFNCLGNKIVSCSPDGTARVWQFGSAADGSPECRTQTIIAIPSRSVASFHPQTDNIAVTCDSDINIHSSDSGDTLSTLRHHSGVILGLQYSKDGSLLASSSADKTVCIWDTASGTVLHILVGHSKYVVRACFNEDGGRVVTAACDFTARLWDSASGDCLLTFKHSWWVNDVCFSHDGSSILTAGDDGSIIVWEAESGLQTRVLTGHQNAVYAVACRSMVTGSFI